MKNHDHSTILHLHRFTPGRVPQTPSAEETSLTVSIQRGAKAVADGGARIIAPAGTELPPTQMLGAVSYCYVKGVYDSAEIEDRMRRTPELCAATHDNVPSAPLIRRFRRLNREAIHTTLEQAFRFLRRKAKASAREPLPGQPLTSTHQGCLNAETTVTFVRKEAERTLNDAAFVDNMSKD